MWEWTDAVISGSSRGLRGGSWLDSDVDVLAPANRDIVGPSFEYFDIGFRVASVPEPTSLVLTMLVGGVMRARRKR